MRMKGGVKEVETECMTKEEQKGKDGKEDEKEGRKEGKGKQ